jgi:hypothetical protein
MKDLFCHKRPAVFCHAASRARKLVKTRIAQYAANDCCSGRRYAPPLNQSQPMRLEDKHATAVV